jgi:type 1 glutamine amidotransferase
MAPYETVLLANSDDVSATDTSSRVTEDVQQAFVGYVRAGDGLLAAHSGTGYAKKPVIRGPIGGAFIRHMEQCPVTVDPQEGRPLTGGRSPLTLRDEHYLTELDDSEADGFMATPSEHGSEPGGWIRPRAMGVSLCADAWS